ncbi:Bifunctional adenosylcobalamin biosynthesis protein CobP [Janthinobacterium sp. KBS0711]|uniref:bifunctional adenosylcobinamide kinase/adenosylcobinamide-phosphate guanylyltransferase n=1 Tax=Janthinobacterium sp. KBS0711 TaxID=1649647 RepID=UPI000627B7F0|nr:bifunctional adenosylcobinamide kinase/adenosylcobinamide-phosphate guanylyltransferase [Janthinobacterium sp. KBS0711]KKO64127.1 Bifunctional adenosylcobalamin biosynthesis protein CobP [Janthinobacterium sp. KBS0711]TSD70587.1 bifunctional adenosylcobinamide kinase/adenosylcobinamide-phosphate guanylyltransferase [Janthinobacterium sp. KBS0711]
MTRTLVFGGARSGKSAYAEMLARESGKEVIYIATAQAGDEEMATRVRHHRAQRPAGWVTIEEALRLGDAILREAAPGRLLLVDCLTLWLTNLMFSSGETYPDVGDIALPELFHSERTHLLYALAEIGETDCDLVLVSNEVGMGIVPYGAISRSFTDEAGRLNQAVAAVCDKAVFVAAGLPLYLKGGTC